MKVTWHNNAALLITWLCTAVLAAAIQIEPWRTELEVAPGESFRGSVMNTGFQEIEAVRESQAGNEASALWRLLDPVEPLGA